MRTKERAIADAVMRRVMDNNHKKAKFHLADEIHERFEMNTASCTTSGLNAGDSKNEKLQARVQGLLDPKAQQAEAGDIRTGSLQDKTRVSPAPNAVNNGQGDAFATDASASPDVLNVKRDSYTQLVGRGAGPSKTAGLGDVAKASLDKAADNGGPRRPMGQQSSSSKLDCPEPFLSSTAGSEGERS